MLSHGKCHENMTCFKLKFFSANIKYKTDRYKPITTVHLKYIKNIGIVPVSKRNVTVASHFVYKCMKLYF